MSFQRTLSANWMSESSPIRSTGSCARVICKYLRKDSVFPAEEWNNAESRWSPGEMSGASFEALLASKLRKVAYRLATGLINDEEHEVVKERVLFK